MIHDQRFYLLDQIIKLMFWQGASLVGTLNKLHLVIIHKKKGSTMDLQASIISSSFIKLIPSHPELTQIKIIYYETLEVTTLSKGVVSFIMVYIFIYLIIIRARGLIINLR